VECGPVIFVVAIYVCSKSSIFLPIQSIFNAFGVARLCCVKEVLVHLLDFLLLILLLKLELLDCKLFSVCDLFLILTDRDHILSFLVLGDHIFIVLGERVFCVVVILITRFESALDLVHSGWRALGCESTKSYFLVLGRPVFGKIDPHLIKGLRNVLDLAGS
jgi:hypothetical protein